MTEAEFKEAVRPIVSQYPTPERKFAFMLVWMTAHMAGIPGPRLGVLAREVLYDTLGVPKDAEEPDDDDSTGFLDWPRPDRLN